MQISILEVDPKPPLDPYKPFSLTFELRNGSDKPMIIPDLNRLQIEITSADRAASFKRDFKPPKTLEAIAFEEISVRMPYEPLRLVIDPGKAYQGQFRSFYDMPPLSLGEVVILARATLEDGGVVQSKPFRIPVSGQQPCYQQEFVQGKWLLNQEPLHQKLLLIGEGKNKRLILLSTLHIGFMSVAADCLAPHSTGGMTLLRYWPANKIQPLVASIQDDRVDVFQIWGKGAAFTDKPVLFDTLPLENNSGLIGLARIIANDTCGGLGDYLMVFSHPGTGMETIFARYWRRDWPKSRWMKADIARVTASSGGSGYRMTPCDSGFEVVSGQGQTAMQIDLKTQLCSFRERAAADPSPVKNRVKRKE